MVSNTAGTRNNVVGVSRSEGPLVRTLPVRVQSLVSDTRLARDENRSCQHTSRGHIEERK